MLNRRQQLLFSKLTGNQYITAAELARQLELSEKTIRTRVKELDKELLPCGAHIISKQGYGYRISITDPALYQELIISMSADKQALPTSSQERILYLLSCFLNSRDYVKLDDLSSFLFISRNVLTGDLKKAEEMLSKYDVRLVRKPHYGIRAEGTEFDKRLCIANYLMKPDFILQGHRRRSTNEMKSIGDILLTCIREHNIKLSEVLFQNLTIHIYIALKRMKAGLFMTSEEADFFQSGLGEKEMVIAQDLAKGLEHSQGIVFTQPEIKYMAIHLAGKRSIDEEEGEELKTEIPGRLMDLVTNMLQSVYDSFKIDFRHNRDLILSLSQHMVPLDIRVRYDMGIDNPLLEETKKNYFLAYAIAKQACIVLKEYYHKSLSDDEVGFIALLFALALEQEKGNNGKKNILIVCASGKGSAQLLTYRYKEEFGNYINQIYTCNTHELDNFDLSRVDYIFTTVPLEITVPVPVISVKDFLADREILAVKKILFMGNKSFLYEFYDSRLFFTDIQGEKKEEIIQELCRRIGKIRQLPRGFYEAVLKREQMAQTDFGNLAALPHPYKTLSEENFVCVGILRKPVLWNTNLVQAVFLVSIGEVEQEQLQAFYQLTMNLLLNQKGMLKLIKEASFETLMELLMDDKTIRG
ncbi:BglG family transcription antiterminator [Lacrimispora amygdalina]|uniref:BglG family transcription antiterminator n=1 Tax=Lacrimispora amygdalina TaxID=253257 RepID=UPI00140C6367|nr:BglG family transcription antiterminator [Lacrimispora amygdalina]